MASNGPDLDEPAPSADAQVAQERQRAEEAERKRAEEAERKRAEEIDCDRAVAFANHDRAELEKEKINFDLDRRRENYPKHADGSLDLDLDSILTFTVDNHVHVVVGRTLLNPGHKGSGGEVREASRFRAACSITVDSPHDEFVAERFEQGANPTCPNCEHAIESGVAPGFSGSVVQHFSSNGEILPTFRLRFRERCVDCGDFAHQRVCGRCGLLRELSDEFYIVDRVAPVMCTPVGPVARLSGLGRFDLYRIREAAAGTQYDDDHDGGGAGPGYGFGNGLVGAVAEVQRLLDGMNATYTESYVRSVGDQLGVDAIDGLANLVDAIVESFER